MEPCFLGRGALLVALNSPDAPYRQLTGESEITVNFTEEKGEITDARMGRIENVGAFTKSLKATLSANGSRYSAETLSFLTKSATEVITANVVKTLNVAVGGKYFLSPGLAAVTALDGAALAVNPVKYSVDLASGLVTVLSITATTLPWTFTGTGVLYESNGLGVVKDLEVKALVIGVDVLSGRKFVAEFFRAAFNMTDLLTLVSRDFKQSKIELTLLADNARGESSPLLGRFGTFNFI